MSKPLLAQITTRLSSISDSPALDASVLIAHVLDRPRSWVLAHPDPNLTPGQQKQMDGSLARLERGEPFPYVLGHWEFFGLDFKITPDVLIPRPETELLVEKAVTWLIKNPYKRNAADVGTGSGAIAVSLAMNVPDATILATDISFRALDVAKRNAKIHGVNSRIELVQCDLLPDQSQAVNRKHKIDLLCANLPYIPTAILHRLPLFDREPTIALDGGKDGLKLIRKLIQMAPEYLAPNALLLLEIEASLGRQAIKLAQDMLPNARISLHQDLSGHDRLLEITFP